MKLDAHQHFWRYTPEEYGWIGKGMEKIMRDFLPEDLGKAQDALGYQGSIAVQARQSLEETEFLLKLAESDPRIKGVVGWVDLCADDVEKTLETFAENPLFVGVRHVLQGEKPLFMLKDSFQRGIGMLHKFGLTYDLLLFPQHLPAAEKLVTTFPDQFFVLDHIAKPLIKDRKMMPWESDIKALAQHQNVYCKLSGMVTEADTDHWQVDDFQAYIDIVWEAFGPERLMIGSDWPVCLLGGSYEEVMQIVETYLNQFPEEIQAKVLGQNCAEFYRVAT